MGGVTGYLDSNDGVCGDLSYSYSYVWGAMHARFMAWASSGWPPRRFKLKGACGKSELREGKE